MFQCDTLWCCWTHLSHVLAHAAWYVRWPFAIYASLYATGAGSFLISLRIKSTDGTLVVSTQSLAYAIAHPMRYGGRCNNRNQGSICAFYARMFNMLLFVWPLLLVYFLVMTVAGSAVTALFGGFVIRPNLSSDAFMEQVEFVGFPTAVITVPLGLLVLAIFKRAALFHFLSWATWALLCISPVLIILSVVGVSSYQLNKGEGDTAVALQEFVKSKKHRFCKMIKFN